MIAVEGTRDKNGQIRSVNVCPTGSEQTKKTKSNAKKWFWKIKTENQKSIYSWAERRKKTDRWQKCISNQIRSHPLSMSDHFLNAHFKCCPKYFAQHLRRIGFGVKPTFETRRVAKGNRGQTRMKQKIFRKQIKCQSKFFSKWTRQELMKKNAGIATSQDQSRALRWWPITIKLWLVLNWWEIKPSDRQRCRQCGGTIRVREKSFATRKHKSQKTDVNQSKKMKKSQLVTKTKRDWR